MGRWEFSGFIQGWGSESKIFFLFLMLIKGTKRQDRFKIICMVPGIEKHLISSASC